MRLLPLGICETPLMPQSLQERISQAIAKANESQSQRRWEVFECRFDVGRVINGVYTNHLQINFMSFRVVFKLFHVVISNRFENILPSPKSIIITLYIVVF
jgi:hypothetical protein